MFTQQASVVKINMLQAVNINTHHMVCTDSSVVYSFTLVQWTTALCMLHELFYSCCAINIRLFPLKFVLFHISHNKD